MAPRDPAKREALAWLSSHAKVSRWMRRHGDVRAAVAGAGGLLRIERFLPPAVAEGVLHVLEGVRAREWNDTAADEDARYNNISHEFRSTKHAAGAELDIVLRALAALVPGQYNAFSAGRYDAGHHIDPHDDRAYTPVMLDTGEVITCSRDLTLVYYLTKDWTANMGGLLVDLEACDAPGSRREYVPKFNSAILFTVPRYHQVTPVTTDRPRYSIFGWFLQPGKLYDLYTGDTEGAEPEQEAAAAQGRRALTAGHEAEEEEEEGEQEGEEGATDFPPSSSSDQEAGAGGTAKRRRAAGQPRGDAPAASWCKLAACIQAHAAKRRRRQKQGGEQPPRVAASCMPVLASAPDV